MNVILSLRRNNGRLLRPISARGAPEAFCVSLDYKILYSSMAHDFHHDGYRFSYLKKVFNNLKKAFWLVPWNGPDKSEQDASQKEAHLDCTGICISN